MLGDLYYIFFSSSYILIRVSWGTCLRYRGTAVYPTPRSSSGPTCGEPLANRSAQTGSLTKCIFYYRSNFSLYILQYIVAYTFSTSPLSYFEYLLFPPTLNLDFLPQICRPLSSLSHLIFFHTALILLFFMFHYIR